jgi:hypothetical protein
VEGASRGLYLRPLSQGAPGRRTVGAVGRRTGEDVVEPGPGDVRDVEHSEAEAVDCSVGDLAKVPMPVRACTGPRAARAGGSE